MSGGGLDEKCVITKGECVWGGRHALGGVSRSGGSGHAQTGGVARQLDEKREIMKRACAGGGVTLWGKGVTHELEEWPGSSRPHLPFPIALF